MIPQKRILPARRSGYRLTHWLLGACFLTSSAIAQNATLTILAANQGNPGNIIVDGSRVYWINTNNAVVSSVDKLNGGVVRVHNPAGTNSGPGNYDLVQDNVKLYFASAQIPIGIGVGVGANFNLFSVPKTSSLVTQLTVDPCTTCAGCTNSWDDTLAISNGWLYYTGGQQEIGNTCTNYTTTIEKISTQGGAPGTVGGPHQVIPIAANWPANFGYSANYLSTDNVYVHWSDTFANAILRVPFAGALAATTDVSSAAAQALITPATGPAGGYIFWVETTATSSALKVRIPGVVPVTLLQGVVDPGLRCFVQVGSFVYCTRASDQTIVRIPINGGTATVAVGTVDAYGPEGLTSDGTYLYWTAFGNGSIRRITLPIGIANPATLVGAFSATLNGVVNPNGIANLTTNYNFQYSTDPNFGLNVVNTPKQNYIGSTPQNVSANISLNPKTTYFIRVVVGDPSYSNVMSFTTLSATGPPVVTNNPATNVASFSATLNGSLDPHGLTTSVHFQYGTTTSYGLNTAAQSYTGNTYLNIAGSINNLSASTTYHFRIVGTNSAGTTNGADQTFTTLSPTGKPVVTTNPATLIASFSATLNGSLDPHGLTTNVYFEYGTTTSYGFKTGSLSQTGDTYRNIIGSINNLSASTTYHFRIVATNSAGMTNGADRTFTTLSPTGPPVVTTNPATNVASFSATLNGSLDPHGLTTSVRFQYGTTTNYAFTTGSAQAPAGNAYINVIGNIGSLAAHTTYHFRIVATNSAGTTNGTDRTFTTL